MTCLYTPRRASKRWLDADCPKGVLDIFDHPDFADRYTIFYVPDTKAEYSETWIDYLGTSGNPQAFGGHGQLGAYKVVRYRYDNNHQRIKWSSLPEAVKAVVKQDLTEEK